MANLHAITQVLEKTAEHKHSTLRDYFYYEKVSDSIQYRAVFEALKANAVQEKYITKGTYAEGTAQVRTEKLSGKIKIMKGVRQGDTLSPVRFTAAVQDIFKRMNIEAGININGVKLSNLRFADFIILFAESAEKLNDMQEKERFNEAE